MYLSKDQTIFPILLEIKLKPKNYENWKSVLPWRKCKAATTVWFRRWSNDPWLEPEAALFPFRIDWPDSVAAEADGVDAEDEAREDRNPAAVRKEQAVSRQDLGQSEETTYD
jgi:hypothetical protein